MDHTTLRKEILDLIATLDAKKKQLFQQRLQDMIRPHVWESASDIVISISEDEKNDWIIKYTHNTSDYHISNYMYEEFNDETTEMPVSPVLHPVTLPTIDKVFMGQPIKKTTQIIFGKVGKKYFLKGGINFNIYRNSSGELRITNPDYDYEIEMDDHKLLIRNYSKNPNIPESMALCVFMYMVDNKWDDMAIINYLSVV
jgi:hypothetical protein